MSDSLENGQTPPNDEREQNELRSETGLRDEIIKALKTVYDLSLIHI